jgi:hypothetical protein
MLILFIYKLIEELDGPAVSALGVRSRKLSNVGPSVHWMGDQKSTISSSFVLRKDVKLLVPPAFSG